MKNQKNRNNQSGMALLAALLIVVIFTIMGMMNAKKAKEGEKVAGGNDRYQVVFQAAELSLRNAVEYINKSEGELEIGYAGQSSAGRNAATNFDISGLSANRPNILYNPDNAIVWDRNKLRGVFCGSETACESGIDFMRKMDQSFWDDHGIKSTFTDNSDNKNHIRNTETYVFIEFLQKTIGGMPVVGGGKIGLLGDFNATGSSEVEIFYLITVKSSGFPPGIGSAKTPLDSKENVVLQAVFAKRG